MRIVTNAQLLQDREWKYVLDRKEETRIVTTGGMQMECAYKHRMLRSTERSGILRRMGSGLERHSQANG